MLNQLKEELLSAIEEEMAANDLSQAEVARQVGVLRRNFNQILGRKRSVTIDQLLKIAEVIELQVDFKFRRK